MSLGLRRSLRYRHAWFTVGMLIALAITVSCLVPSRDLPQIGFALSDKVEHGMAFFILTFWFAGVLTRHDFLFLALALLALGGGIEIAQGLMGLGREPDLKDLLADGAGVLLGFVLAMTPLGRWALFIESLVTTRRS